MSLNVGSLMATLDLDKKPFERALAGWRTKTRAEAKAAGRELDAETRRQSDLLGRRGEEAGRKFGDGFHRDSTGRLRDALGRFAKDSDEEGERSGRRWGLGFLRGMKLHFSLDKAKELAEGLGKGLRTGLMATAKVAAASWVAQFVPAVVAGLASGIAKIAHGAGSIAALLPAAALVGVTAMGALKLAVSGVGDALSAAATGDAAEFHEAVKGLSPSARRFALEVRHLRGDLDRLKDSVQERFFSQFEGQTSRLGKMWLPILRRELGGVSGLFGQAVDRMAGWARQPSVVLTLSAALRNARRTLGNLLDGASNLPAAFLPLVAVGSTFLPRLTSGLEGATQRLALFMQHAADTGQLADFIQGGIDKLKELWETAKQVGRIIGNVVDVFQIIAGMSVFDSLNSQGGGLLDTIERLTERAKVFFGQSETGRTLVGVFDAIHTVMSATIGVAVKLARMAGQIFAPLLPDVKKATEGVVKFESSLVDALEPTLRGIASVLGVILPPLTSLLELMADNRIVMGAVAGVATALFAAWAVGAVKAKVATVGANSALLGAAAGVGMLVTAVGAMRDAKQDAAMDEMAEGLAAIDFAATESSKSAILNAEKWGMLDEQFARAEESGGGMAAKLVDLMEAAGVADDTVAQYRQEVEQAADAQDNQTDAIQRTADALRAQNDPIFAAISAQAGLAEAQRAVIEARDEYGAGSPEHIAAQVAATEAASRFDGALLGLAQAASDGDITVAGFRATLARWVSQGAITQQSADVTWLKFVALSRAAEDVPDSVRTSVSVTGVGAVLDNLELIRQRLNSITGGSFHVSSPAHGGGGKTMHEGGVVPGRRGEEVAAVLQAGERVLSIHDPLNHMLTRGAAQLARGAMAVAAPGAAGPAGGVAGTVRLVIEGTGILSGLREECFVQAGGNVQVFLGDR